LKQAGGMSFSWLNEPADWSGDTSNLTISTGKVTDFWRETFYGFVRDNGHAYLQPISGDFTASAIVAGAYEQLYDQAGLILRVDERNWVKTGIEYTDGMMHFSVVVTNDVSDWSVIPLPNASPNDELHVRLTRHGATIRVQYAIGGATWQMARLAPFSPAVASVGVMACSPEREGLRAHFRDIRVGPAIARMLHDD
jgi:regulation of enolase protein 1 (concanavalin A-like superfamily)